jgi:hypothetical protein
LQHRYTYHAHRKLAGVIYLYDISQTRTLDIPPINTDSDVLRELYGDGPLATAFLVTTKWGYVDVKVEDAREEQLIGGLLKPMLANGLTTLRFHENPASAQAILDAFCDAYSVRGISNSPRIQHKVPKARWRKEIKSEDPIFNDGRPTDIVILCVGSAKFCSLPSTKSNSGSWVLRVLEKVL